MHIQQSRDGWECVDVRMPAASRHNGGRPLQERADLGFRSLREPVPRLIESDQDDLMADVGMAAIPRTLAIDIGGSGLKMMTLGASGEPLNIRSRCKTPRPATPCEVLAVLEGMVENQPEFDRVAAGFPGVVTKGVTLTAVNLHPDWIGFDFGAELEAMTGKPARVANDADVQGLAVIEGSGVEFVLTLGTGLGSALYVETRLVPNLEIAHHVFRKNMTYEDCLGNAALARYGRSKWNQRLAEAVGQLEQAFNYGRLYIGGGNASKVQKGLLPGNVRLVSNVAGLLGCIRLWGADPSRRV